MLLEKGTLRSLAFALSSSFLIAGPLQAATTRVWRQAQGNLASEGLNWIGNQAPAAGDSVVFGNQTAGQHCLWDLNVAIDSFSITGLYGSTVILQVPLTVSSGVMLNATGAAWLDLNGSSMTVMGDWTVGDMRTTSTVAGSSVAFRGSVYSKVTRTTAGPARFNNMVVDKNAGIIVAPFSDIEVNDDFTLLNGSYTLGAHFQHLKGDLNMLNGYFDLSPGTVVFRGALPQRMRAGTVDGAQFGAAGFWIQNSTAVTLINMPLGVLIATQANTTLFLDAPSQAVQVGSMTLNGQASTSRVQLLSAQFGGKALLKVLNYSSVGNAFVKDIDASQGNAVTAAASVDGGNNVNWTFTGGGGGVTRTWSHGGVNNLASTAGNWSPSGPPSAGDAVVFGNTTPTQPCSWDLSVPLSTWSITGSYASTVTLLSDVTLSSGVLLDAGSSSQFDLKGRHFKLQGDWLVGDVKTTSTVAGSSVTFFGSGTSRLKRTTAGRVLFENAVFEKGTQAKVLTDLELGGAFTLNAGSFTSNGFLVHVFADLNFKGGFVDVKQSTIVMRGTQPQSMTLTGSPTSLGLGGLWVQNPGRVQLISLPLDVLIATTPNTTLLLSVTGSLSVSSMNINGQASGTRIQVISPAPDTSAALNALAFATATFVYVQDINASGGIALTANSSVDGGNNTNWTFPAGGGTTKYWKYAGGSSSASTSGNWNPAGPPGAGDYVVFGSTTPSAPCSWDLPIIVSSLSVTGAYNSTITLTTDLTISSGALLTAGSGAKLDLNGHRLTARGDWVVGDMNTVSAVTGSTVAFDGAGVAKIKRTSSGAARFNHLIMEKLTTGGAQAELYSDIEVLGDLYLKQSTFLPYAHYQVLRGDMIFGDVTYTAASSTVVFAGAADQKMTLAGTPTTAGIAGLHIQTASTVTLQGIPAEVFIATTGSAGVVLAQPITVQRATIDGQGTGTRVRLRSSVPGSQRALNFIVSVSVQYADVQDMDSSFALQPTAQASIDRGNNLNWDFPAFGVITASSFTAVQQSSLTAHWDSTYPGNIGYTAELSSGSFPNAFTGNQSSTTANHFASYTGLLADTSYYVRVSTIGGTFANLNSSSTLAAPLTGVSILGVFGSSITVGWNTQTCQGYRLEASTNPAFDSVIFASSTYLSALNQLTVIDLSGLTTYYLRAGPISWTGGANFTAVGSTASLLGLPTGCDSGVTVGKSGADYTTVMGALAAIPSSLTNDTCVVFRDTQTYSEQVTVQGKTTNGFRLRLMTEPSLSRGAIIDPPTGSTAAFQVMNASVTIEDIAIITTNTVAYGVLGSSVGLTLSLVNVDSGGSIWKAGISLSTSGSISGSSVTVQDAHGIHVTGSSCTITNSSTTNNSSGSSALFINGVDYNTLTSLYILNSGFVGLRMSGGSDYNTVVVSTMIGTNGEGLLMQTASSNTVSRSTISFSSPGPSQTILISGGSNNTFTDCFMFGQGSGTAMRISGAHTNSVTGSVLAGGRAARLDTSANYNSFTNSILRTSWSGLQAVSVESLSRSNVFSGDVIRNSNASSTAMQIIGGSSLNLIDLSTVTTNDLAQAVYFQSAASNTISNSYVEGSTAVVVSDSTGTVVQNSVLYAVGADNAGLSFQDLSLNLSLLNNAIYGGSAGAGVVIKASSRGSLVISTNTFAAGRYGLSIATQAAGAFVAVTSNTFVPQASAAQDAYGLFLDGLTTGATIYNNALVHRKSASAAGRTVYGLYARSSAGLKIDHNRFSNPGLVTAGSVVNAFFTGSTGVTFKFNDVHSTGTTLTNAYLLQLTGSTATIKDNVFFASLTVTGSSATFFANGGGGITGSGFVSNYNDFFSAAAANTAIWGTQSRQLASAWTTYTGQDAASLTADPLWYSPSAEDFHPRSLRGRWDPVAQGFAGDASHAATIDSGDPAESFIQEQGGDNLTVNMGSYGNTPEASQSARAPGIGAAVVNVTSVTVSYGAVSSDGYTVDASLDPLFTSPISSTTGNPGVTTLAPQGLTPNDTYYLRVGALYGSTYLYTTVSPASTVTLAAVPSSLVAAPLVLSSATLSWASGGNAAGTTYIAEVSSNGFTTVTASSRTLNFSVLFNGLWPNTTQFFRVKAENRGGLNSSTATVSASTLADAVVAGQIKGVFNSTITANWQLLPSSPPNASSRTAEGYILQASTAPDFTGTLFSSSTPNVALGTLTVSGLSGTTYYLRVGSLDWNSAPHYTFLGSTKPVTALPGDCFAGFIVRQDGNGDFTTIQGAVDALPGSLTVDTCIMIQDAMTYGEQVRVEGITNNGKLLKIFGDRVLSSTATVIAPIGLSTAGFIIANTSVTLENMTVRPAGAVQFGVLASSFNVTLSSVNVDSNGMVWGAGISYSSFSLVQYSSVTVQAAHGFYTSGTNSTLSRSTAASAGGGSLAAVFFDGASSQTVSRGFFSNSAGTGVRFNGGAGYHQLSLSTMTGSGASSAGLYVTGGSYDVVSQSYMADPDGIGLSLQSGVHHVSVSLSTSVSTLGGSPLNIAAGVSSNTLSQSSFWAGSAGSVLAGDYNLVSQSTFTGGSTGAPLLDVAGQGNTLAQSYLSNPPGDVLFFSAGQGRNTVSQSTASANASGVSALQVWTSSNVFLRSVFSNPGGAGVIFSGYSGANTIALSTAIGTSSVGTDQALRLSRVYSTRIDGCYVQGSTAVYVVGSTDTFVGSSFLVATLASGSALWLADGSSGLSASSNTLLGASLGSGVHLDAGNSGLIILSTNTVRPGGRYGVFAATQTPGTQLWISSNTILPALSSARDTAGLFFSGLASGATVEFNNVYLRTAGSMGSFRAYGLQARSSSGLVIRGNRFADRAMVTAGSYEAVSFFDVDEASFLSNDVEGGGAGMTDAFLLRLQNGSTGVKVKDNVFLSSFAVSGASATLAVSADSQAGFQSDYNDFFSSNAFNTGWWGAASYQFTAPWQAGSGQDAGSLAQQPLWHDPAGEDYHPRSAKGRFDPATGLFVSDGVTSPTIDAGDPGAPLGSETAPNGGRLNLGSYGGTAEASQSAVAPSGVAVAGVSGSSVALTWTPVSADGYRADVALSADFLTGLVSSATTNSAAATLAVQGLGPNTTYYARVGALYGTSYIFAGAAPASTVTYANAPTSGVQLFTALSSAAFSWSSNGNPAGTLFEARVSTDFFFASGFSSQTLSVSATFFALTANATYYLRVRSIDHGGTASSDLMVQTTTTFPASPASPNGAVSGTQAGLSWSGVSANDLGTLYRAQVSTDNFATVNASSVTLNASATFFYTPLSNTTFYLRARTEGYRQTTPYAVAASSASDALSPMLTSLSAVELSSMTVGWIDINPAGARFETQVSTDAFSTFSASSVTMNSSALFAGLLSNTTYYARTRVLGHNGTPTAYTLAVTTITDPSPPSSSPVSAVTASSVRAEWGAAGNGAGTSYLAQLSTDAFSTVNVSSLTLNPYADFGGLLSATTYYFQVRAQGFAGLITSFTALPSTVTLLQSPGSAAVPVAAVGLSSALVQWTSGGNGPGTLYEAQTSTDAFASVNASSFTYNVLALFGTGGLAPALSPGTTFQFRVRAGSGGNVSAFVAIGSTATLPADPSGLTMLMQATTGTLSWSGSGNGGAAAYRAQISTDAFTTVNAASATYNLSADFTGLAANTTYYLRVRSEDPAGLAGVYQVAAASATAAAAPGALAPVLSLSSGVVSWPANGNPAGTVYDAEVSTDSFATLNVASRTLSAGAAFLALEPNTTYYLRARAFGHSGGYTAYSSTTGATVPADPGAAALKGVELSSAAVSWTANGNPAGTLYEAQLSTDAFATLNLSSRTLSPQATFFALASNATYYLRVQTLGHGGTGTAFSVLPATATLPADPGAAPVSLVALSSVQVNWLANGNAAPTLYEARLSTDAFATVNASSLTYSLAAVFSGLSSNATYYFQARSRGHDGRSSAYTSLGSTITLITPPAAAGTTFLFVDSAAVSFQWASGGNGAGTTYVARVSTDSFATVNLSSVTLNLAARFGSGGLGALTPNTTYFFDVKATNGATSSASVPLGSTTTFPAPPAAPAGAMLVSAATVSWTAGGNPAGTLYDAQASTDTFATLNASSRTLNTSAFFTGLQANTTFYLRVRAVSHTGTLSAFTVAAASATSAAAPASPAPAAVDLSSVTLSWTANGNPALSVYEPAVSTDSFATINFSTRTTAALFSFTALQVNTTYYLRVRTLGHGSAFSAAVSTASATRAADPAAALLTAVELSSAALSWSVNGNPVGTWFQAQASTDAFATVSASSQTQSAGAAFFGLLSNTTYYLRVQALNRASLGTAFVAAGATATLVASPGSAPPSAVAATSLQAEWSPNGNGAGTLYLAQISTNAFTTVNESSVTFSTSAVFSGLAPSTAYDLRVRAQGHNGTSTAFVSLPSTTTLLLPPVALAAGFTTVGLSSAAVQWGSGGNGPATVYQARVSTDSFATVNFTSATLNVSALFGTGGAGPALSPNTTYQFDVRATNGPSSSAIVPLGSTATHAASPLSTAVESVSSTTAVLNWSPSGNPEPGTVYELWRDGDGAFPAPVKVALSTSGAVVTGLSAGATYYFKARAREHGGAYTGFDAVVSAATLPPAPGPAGNPSGFALGVSSLSWSWTAAPLAQGYRVRPASNTALLIASTPTVNFIQAGLLVNRPYGILVAGYNASGDGPLSAAATVYTLANPPTGTASSQVQGTSATVSWGLNGNPAATLAEVQRSTDNAVFAGVYSSSATSYIDFGLIGCTTYYYRVRNRNGDSLATVFDSTIGFVTRASTPAAPGGLTADSLAGNKVLLGWTASATEGITQYKLYSDGGTGVVNYAAPIAVMTSTETAFTTGVLVSSAAYTFALRAKHRCGVEETGGVFAQAAASAALPTTRAAVRSPAAGKRVSGNRLTVVAELTTGTPSLTQKVGFQYKCSTNSSSGWVNISTVTTGQANPDPASPYFLHWDVTNLTPAGYDLRAVAYDLLGSSDPFPSAISVVVDPVVFDINESLVGQNIEKKQAVVSGASNLISATDAAGHMSRIVLPIGALNTSSATLTVVNGPTLPAAAPVGALDAGIAMEITLDNGQKNLGANALLTFSYPDVDGDGIIDGTLLRAEGLKIYSYDPVSGVWLEDVPGAVDSSGKTITGGTSHFSFFAAFPQAAALGLDTIRVYPVPYKPYGDDPDQGRPYNAAQANSGIIFDNLPLSVTIKVYTVTGQLVTQFSSNNTNGRLQWDVRNGDGRDLASGGYFAVISAPGQKSVVKRLSVIR